MMEMGLGTIQRLKVERRIEQGGTAKAAFNAVDGTIDRITTTVLFSYCNPNPCGEIARTITN
jgi:hypothetical protein